MDNCITGGRIGTIFLDADGVLQRTESGWRRELTDLLGDRADAEGERFVTAIQRADAPTMDGSTDIVAAISDVLREFSVTADAEDVLDLWTRITPDAGMVDAVRELSAEGYACYLTTNQQTQRAAWMRRHLGYDELFDDAFYSCELGLAKPDPLYFTTVCERVGVDPATVLFVDDTKVNIDGARSAGLDAHLFPVGRGRTVLDEILGSHALRLRRVA